jgi:hypothetical protein
MTDVTITRSQVEFHKATEALSVLLVAPFAFSGSSLL